MGVEPISVVCYQFHSFPFRDVSTNISGLRNQHWVYEGPPIVNDGASFRMDLMGLYALFPSEYSQAQIKDAILLFGSNTCKHVAMEAYNIAHF
jgi:hypothetical protein